MPPNSISAGATPQTPLGSLQRSPNPVAVFKGYTLKGREKKGRKGKRKKGAAEG